MVKKGQEWFCANSLLSFFKWLQVKSGIQSASHIRSLPGLFS